MTPGAVDLPSSETSTSATGPSASPRAITRRRVIGYGYLLLVVASFITQVFTDRPAAVPDDYRVASLPTQERQGPVQDADDRGRIVPSRVDVAYRIYGPEAGPPVVLLHGSPGSASDFHLLAPALALEGYRVVVPDLPGFGYSARWVPDYSNKAHARYVFDLLDELGIESAHFVGFSMSGGVVLRLYEQQPQRMQTATLLAAIGIQEGEGSGDYYFEHLKYGIGYLLLVGGMEFVPNFGMLEYAPAEPLQLIGTRSDRHAFLRNFWDTDQRDYRGTLERFDKPMLIIHAERDPMIPAWTAYEHHRIVEHSELVMRSADDFAGDATIINHMMMANERGNGYVIDALLPFLERHRDPGVQPVRRTLDLTDGDAPASTLRLPGDLEVRRSMNAWAKIGVIIVGTLILEDPTSIAVGLFIKAGQIDLLLGVFAVLVGIFLGDLLLYLIGYVVGRRALRWAPIARWVPTRQVDMLGDWFDRKGWKAVLASRFVPGTRLPLYVAAGVTGNKPGRFMLWTFLAVCIWVPVIIGLVMVLGKAARSPFQVLLDFGGWPAFVGVVLLLMFVMHNAVLLLTRGGRRRLVVKLRRQVEREYWSAWRYYLPMIPYWLYLMARHRSLTVWMLANPGMPDGGVVGESKSDILAGADDPAILPHAFIAAERGAEQAPQAVADRRAGRALAVMQERGWSFPIILKPDAAQRGAGVRLVHDADEVNAFFAATPGDAQLQVYHPGPCEAGVFYIRHPDHHQGKIFSITDKVFPFIEGDGEQTIEELIWRHPRYRMQHDMFHVRMIDRLQEVPGPGERVTLGMAGNHVQGCMFKDGGHLITPELEARIDELAKRVEGFYFGRIDLRYKDAASFKRGEDLAVIEINGVTSESTNLYDPSWSFWRAQRVLREQWRHLCEIGAAHRRRGLKAKSVPRLLLDILKYYREREIVTVSD
ncbi:MAG: alpha/beta fold hydrolase [Planctomycetota bacterium]